MISREHFLVWACIVGGFSVGWIGRGMLTEWVLWRQAKRGRA